MKFDIGELYRKVSTYSDFRKNLRTVSVPHIAFLPSTKVPGRGISRSFTQIKGQILTNAIELLRPAYIPHLVEKFKVVHFVLRAKFGARLV
jgi:hypothetical protein